MTEASQVLFCSCLIRWTEVFIISSLDPPDPARAAEGVARAVCLALLPSLPSMKDGDLSPLAVRVSTDPDNVSRRGEERRGEERRRDISS